MGVTLPAAYASASIAPHVIGTHEHSLHYRSVVIEEGLTDYLVNFTYYLEKWREPVFAGYSMGHSSD
jgi:hypothetical protein